MFDIDKIDTIKTTTQLAKIGYWPAQASLFLSEEKYSKAVALCKENLQGNTSPLSARFIYAKALYHAGQVESSEQQLHIILSKDSEHIASLKYLADIKFQQGDQFGAMSLYEQILSLEPYCTILYSSYSSIEKKKEQTTTTTITLKRQKEIRKEPSKKDLRKVLIYTETVGDLYLQQGFPGLAEEVFAHLHKKSKNPRFAEKLSLARENIKDKEHHHVKNTD